MKLVSDIMSKEVVSVSANNTLREALDIMQEKGRTKLPVLRDGELVGIIVRYDIEQGTRRPGIIWETPVEWIMSKKLLILAPTDEVIKAAKIFVEHKIGGMPVIDDDKMVGFVSKNDIISLFIDYLEQGCCNC